MNIIESALKKLKPNVLSLVPLRDMVIFPSMIVPFFVGRKKSIASVEEAMSRGKLVFLLTQRDVNIKDPKQSDLYLTGTISKILQMLKLPDGTIRLLAEGLERATVVKYEDSRDVFRVQVKPIREDNDVTPELSALIRTVQKEFSRYAAVCKKIPVEIVTNCEKIESPGKLINTICSHAPLKVSKKMELLSETNTQPRLENLAMTLVGEKEVLELEQKINSKIRKRYEKTQKDFFLQEQLKEIQRELGDKGEDPSGATELKGKLAMKGLPSEVHEKCMKEINRLSRLQPMSPESGILRTYLEWITDLPWIEFSHDNKDIEAAKIILDEDHYDLKEVKERILDFIAVRQLKGKVKGPILCFVGPPGTGKTSLGRSVARALGRNFIRISLGGVRDEAEIRGHRKTYIGALPGKIIQSMKKAGTKNPVFLLDEIDKMSSDFRGDPAAALLEVLDPEQNNTFMDHYLEVQYDLSDVMFITTANSSHNIPFALRDRMEVIEISGYTEFEKEKIAEEFLIPKQLKENGLDWADIVFQKSALLTIIRNYTMESGVRNLERELANVLRKIAREAVKKGFHETKDSEEDEKTFKVVITKNSLTKYLGKIKYKDTFFTHIIRPGLSYGLAWTEKGGMLLPVEVAVLKGKGELILTGNLGDVMKESAHTALSFLRANALIFGVSLDFYKDRDIHVHVPEGAIPKDGPSAGITIATALLSAIRGIPMKKGYAMTGEITLTGRILPIGGVKEKVLAAHRNKMTHVLIPSDNKKDIDELPKAVLDEMKFEFSESIEEALFKLFPNDSFHQNEIASA
ncbi:MAG: endopeptidase La [Spirochaetales bacterium]|nr:endopeptidase La [Spirochaetales bacterium]